jgi:hypothetical protein
MVESDTNAIEVMTFARGFGLVNDFCGYNRVIRGETNSLDVISIIDNKIVNIPMKLILKIIQGEYSQSNKLSTLSVAQSFLRGQC